MTYVHAVTNAPHACCHCTFPSCMKLLHAIARRLLRRRIVAGELVSCAIGVVWTVTSHVCGYTSSMVASLVCLQCFDMHYDLHNGTMVYQSRSSYINSAHAAGGAAIYEATINSLRSILSDREQQLNRLEADLAVAKAYSGSSQRLMGESAQGESALRIELDVLRRRLTEKEAQVVSGEERLSRLEAVHRVAQVILPGLPKAAPAMPQRVVSR